jgi:hypothetical protein
MSLFPFEKIKRMYYLKAVAEVFLDYPVRVDEGYHLVCDAANLTI